MHEVNAKEPLALNSKNATLILNPKLNKTVDVQGSYAIVIPKKHKLLPGSVMHFSPMHLKLKKGLAPSPRPFPQQIVLFCLALCE